MFECLRCLELLKTFGPGPLPVSVKTKADHRSTQGQQSPIGNSAATSTGPAGHLRPTSTLINQENADGRSVGTRGRNH